MKASGNLFDRRLLFVVGKGGVGKSTVAAALAFAALRRRKRVLLVGLDGVERLRAVFGLDPGEAKAEPAEILPGLCLLNVDGKTALEEYLRLVVPVRRVLSAIFESRVYQYFVAAAPGLKELMAIGKIWYEVDRKKWDVVIVDCPATGHALQYLRMPRTAIATFPKGLVNREATRVWELLSDPAATAISIVTTAEEMPTNETLEICEQLREDLRLPEGWIFVNRFHAPDFSEAEVAAARPASGGTASARALVAEVIARAEEEVRWGALNEGYRRKLADGTDWRLLCLPFLFREEFGVSDVEDLAGRIAAGVEAPERAPARRGGAKR